MNRLALFIAIGVAMGFSPAVALADTPKDGPTAGIVKKSIDAGIKCYEELNYGCAITRLVSARDAVDAHGLQIARSQRRRMLRTLAFAFSSVEKHDDAKSAFFALINEFPKERLDPNVVSPKIMANFNAARIEFFTKLVPIPIQPLPPVTPFLSQGPGKRDLVLHVPEELRLASRVRTDEEIVHTIGFEAGGGLLFGNDTDNFSTGFTVGLTYSYELVAPIQVGLRLGFGQHGTSRSDVKAGYPSRLLVFHGGPELRAAFDLGDYVELAIGVAPSIHASGVGTLGDKIGGLVLGTVSVMARPVPEIGIGVAVLPGVVLAPTSDGLGSSFVLPVSLRLEGAF